MVRASEMVKEEEEEYSSDDEEFDITGVCKCPVSLTGKTCRRETFSRSSVHTRALPNNHHNHL